MLIRLHHLHLPSIICNGISKASASASTRGLTFPPHRPNKPFSSSLPTRNITTTMSHDHKLDAEAEIKRNPHPDFKTIEASRLKWDETREWKWTQTRAPDWQLGDGGNDGGASLSKEHVEIDPYADGRPAVFNYKLLISAIIPRPVGFVSTMSEDGTSSNLAPFSYTQVVNHDPPVFIIGFAGGLDRAKDTLKNLLDTRECTINMISEHMLEAANSTSINAPFGVSEWALSGLHPAPCSQVKCSRVRESVFSVECKLMDTKEFESRASPGKKTGVLAIVEGVRFWAREDALNKEGNLIDPGVLRPIARLGGITYARVLDGIEIPRPDFETEVNKGGKGELKKKKVEGQ